MAIEQVYQAVCDGCGVRRIALDNPDLVRHEAALDGWLVPAWGQLLLLCKDCRKKA